jgi:phage-related protein
MNDGIKKRGVSFAQKGKRAGRAEKVPGDQVGGDKISVGKISGSQGVAIGRGARATVQSGIGSKELSELFSAIYQKIETRSPDPEVEKEEITDQVKRIESEVARGEKAQPVKVERWLRNLAAMAPDIVDVTLATLTSPFAGISMAIRKIAHRVKEELP